MRNTNATIQEYNRKASALSKRYESADVIKLQKTLLATFNNCETILELGCGSGRDAAFLNAFLPEVVFTITDGSEEMLSQAAKQHPELSDYLVMCELPDMLEDEINKFDGIYSIAALMHLSENEIIHSLKLITGLLEKDGILFLSVCTSREVQKKNDPRSFTLKNKLWWISEIEKTGLSVASATDNTDGLNRDNTVWLNLTAVNRND